MDENSQQKFYSDNYRIFEFGQSRPPDSDRIIQTKRAEHLVSLLKPYSSHFFGKVHLDIGSGLGILLRETHKAFGTIGAGVEPDKVYRNYTNTNENIPIFPVIEDWQGSTCTTAFLVTMSHVLEHLPDPITYLRFIREEVLSKDGFLLIEVPNLYYHSSLELAHAYAFTPHTLTECLQKAGFRIVFHKHHGLPLRRTPRYITVIAQPCETQFTENYKVAAEPRGVSTKRGIGRCISRFEDKIYILHGFLKRVFKRLRRIVFTRKH